MQVVSSPENITSRHAEDNLLEISSRFGDSFKTLAKTHARVLSKQSQQLTKDIRTIAIGGALTLPLFTAGLIIFSAGLILTWSSPGITYSFGELSAYYSLIVGGVLLGLSFALTALVGWRAYHTTKVIGKMKRDFQRDLGMTEEGDKEQYGEL